MKNPFHKMTAIALVCFFSITAGLACAAEKVSLPLAKEGASSYSIVIPAKPTVQEKFAADELAKYLKKISSAELPIVSKTSGPRIVVAVAKDGKGPGGIKFTKEESEYDAFVIKTEGKDLYLIGSNKRGVLYAVYTLLEKHLGCRWPALGVWFQTEEQKKTGEVTQHIEEYIPAARNITLAAMNERQKASFKYRGLISYAWYSQTPLNVVDWAAKNKLNYFWIPMDQYDAVSSGASRDWRKEVVEGGMIRRGFIIIAGHHAFYYLLNPKKYFKDHPEWFALRKAGRREPGGTSGEGAKLKRRPGGRLHGQFCLSNPEAVKTFRKNFVAFARKYPEVDIFAPCPNDGAGWCQCEKCTKDRIPWEERPKRQATQDLYTRLVNLLNEDLQKLYPGKGKRVGALAYGSDAQPPAREKPAPGIFISYAFFTRSHYTVPWGNAKGEASNAGYRDKRAAINAKFLKKWVELTKDTGGDVTMYSYYCGRSSWHGIGFYLMHLISTELAFFQKIGVTGAAPHLSSWTLGKKAPANLYVFAKNCWDTSLETDAILAEYAEARFGKAAGPMIKYLNEAERNCRKHLKYRVRGKKAQAERDKSLADCQKYLDQAKALADTKQAKKNIADEEANFKKLRDWQLGK